jgi:hypothetical protein
MAGSDGGAMEWDTEEVLAARAIVPYLPSLLGERANDVRVELEWLLSAWDRYRKPPIAHRIVRLLTDYPATQEWMRDFLHLSGTASFTSWPQADRGPYAPPSSSLSQPPSLSLPGTAGADDQWWRSEPGTANRPTPPTEGGTPRAGPSGGSAIPVLVVRTRRSEHTLHGGRIYHIGRDPASDIVMTDSRVSWRHAVLQVEGYNWVLGDLGSTNGTFLGRQRLDRIELNADCVVRLGNPDDGPVLRCMPETASPAGSGTLAGLAEAAPPQAGTIPAAPRTSAEGMLAEMLAEVMKVKQVPVDSHFFDELGADSLVMAKFCARVREREDLPSIAMKDIYAHPTIRSLAESLGLDVAKAEAEVNLGTMDTLMQPRDPIPAQPPAPPSPQAAQEARQAPEARQDRDSRFRGQPTAEAPVASPLADIPSRPAVAAAGPAPPRDRAPRAGSPDPDSPHAAAPGAGSGDSTSAWRERPASRGAPPDREQDAYHEPATGYPATRYPPRSAAGRAMPRSAPGLTRRAWSKLRDTVSAGSRRTRPGKAAAETTRHPEPAIERARRDELQPAEDRPPTPHMLPDDPAPRHPEGSAVDATRPGDRVECSVFAPPVVSPGSAFLIQVFAHISGRAREAMRRAREFDADSARRAIKTLESSVSRGTRLAFCLTMPDLRVDGPMQSMVWWGTTESVQFGVSVPKRCRPGGVMGTITISQDSIPIGHIKFILTVAASLPAGQARPAPSSSAVGEAAKRYEMAFVSYASADRTKVLERVQLLPMLGIRTFQDVLDLGPGERWEQSLYRHIDESDIVLLFWSNSAKRSKWVRKEVQYALDRKHGDEYAPPEIGPVIIEGPPVPPPWKELAHLHFNDRIIYFMNR